MTDQLDKELLELLQETKELPVVLPVVSEPTTAYGMAQQQFDADRLEYEEEMRQLSQPNDDQEAWKDIAQQFGRM